jgi:hypothetical protein
MHLCDDEMWEQQIKTGKDYSMAIPADSSQSAIRIKIGTVKGQHYISNSPYRMGDLVDGLEQTRSATSQEMANIRQSESQFREGLQGLIAILNEMLQRT